MHAWHSGYVVLAIGDYGYNFEHFYIKDSKCDPEQVAHTHKLPLSASSTGQVSCYCLLCFTGTKSRTVF